MKGLNSMRVVAAVFLCATIVGCASRAPLNSPPALHIGGFTLSQGAVGLHYEQALLATGGQKPYAWAITDGSLPPGLTATSEGVISGTVDCGAPTPPCPVLDGHHSKTYTFTVAVTDSQSPTKAIDMRSESITINQDLSLTAVSLPVGITGLAYNATFMAADGVPPYSYSVLGTPGLPDGLSLTTIQPQDNMPNAASITGVPTNAGVYSFTIQATDHGAETATAVFTITVTGRLQGPYILSLNGFDSTQPQGSQAFYTLVRINASNDVNGSGTIGGRLDQIGANPASNVPISGVYSFPVGTNFGTIGFTRGDTGAGYKFNVVLSSQNDSKMVLSDPDHHVWGAGLLKKQTATNIALNNPIGYSFGAFGSDLAGARYAAAGMFQLDTSLAILGGAEDANDNGTASGEMSITGGSLSDLDRDTGRGAAVLNLGSDTYNYTYYVVSPTELVALANDPGIKPTTIVDIQQQQSANPLGGSGAVICKHDTSCQTIVAVNGVSASGDTPVPEAEVGVLSFVAGSTGSQGTLSRTDGIPPYYTDRSIGGAYDSVSFTDGMFSIDPTCGPLPTACGRVTLTITGNATPPVIYLFNTGQGFLVGADEFTGQGMLQPQAVPTAGFDISSLLGSYLAGNASSTLATITNQISVVVTPPPGGTWEETYTISGPGGVQERLSLNAPYAIDKVNPSMGCDPQTGTGCLGPALGRFAVCSPDATSYCDSFVYDSNSPPVDILYIIGSGGGSGITGIKTGVVGLNLGALQSDGTVVVDPNPRVTTYGR